MDFGFIHPVTSLDTATLGNEKLLPSLQDFCLYNVLSSSPVG